MHKSSVDRKLAFWTFIGVYSFFILDTLLTPILFKYLIVKPHQKFADSTTTQIYGMVESKANPMNRLFGLTNFQPYTFHSYIAIALHNSLLPLLSILIVTIPLMMPKFTNVFVRYPVEYIRLLFVLIFYLYGIIMVLENGFIIPFVIATVSVAIHSTTFMMSTVLLVHGVVEYVALSLVSSVAFVSVRRYFIWRRSNPAPTYKESLTDNPSPIVAFFAYWYKSVFSDRSISTAFLQSTEPIRPYIYKMYTVAIIVFFIASILETFVTPTVETKLMAIHYGTSNAFLHKK